MRISYFEFYPDIDRWRSVAETTYVTRYKANTVEYAALKLEICGESLERS